MNVTQFVRRLFYFRYPLLCGFLLAICGPVACLSDAQQLLGNVLLLETWWQVVTLTAICLVAATICFMQAGMVSYNGIRFGDLPENLDERGISQLAALQGEGKSLTIPAPVRGVAPLLTWEWSFRRTLAWLLAGVSLPLTAIAYSAVSRSDVENFPNTIGWTTGFTGIVGGFALYTGSLAAIVWLESKLFSVNDLIRGLLPIWVRVDPNQNTNRRLLAIDKVLAQYFPQEGYIRDSSPEGTLRFRPGHWQQGILLAFLLLAYFFLEWLTAGSYAKPTMFSLPTSFFAVLLLTIVTTVLSVAAFFFDYYRIPVLLLLALAIWGSYKFSGRDHYFDVTPLPPSCPPADLGKAIAAKPIPPDNAGLRTLVVVTAPGGGIHAAAWTAQVLTGLHLRYGDDYVRSLALISSVSGGSVGAMYYAANFDTLLQARSSAELEKYGRSIVGRAGASGLEAVGWGLVYRDLPGLLPFVDPVGDRGMALDECWRARLLLNAEPDDDGGALTLGSWHDRMAQGTMPVVVFNSTEVESGRRVLFSPVVAGRRESLADSVARPVEFTEVFYQDISVVTAARLSATFPWVSPTATPRTLKELGHLADGGYIDNEGILTAVDWVSRFYPQPDGDNLGDRPFDRVLFIRIRHSAPHDPLKGGKPGQKARARDGFSFAVFGPLKGVATVRGTSQIERGQLEVDLEQVAWPGQVEFVYLDFDERDELDPPLSWKLSPKEFARYAKAWTALEKSEELKKIDAYFKLRE